MINCPKCNILFNEIGKWGIKKFCSRKCANSRPKTLEQKRKMSEIIKFSEKAIEARRQQAIKQRIINSQNTQLCYITCKICKNDKKVPPSNMNMTYCSKKCYLSDPNKKGGSGGYRERSGRSKSGNYRGIYCASTYELTYVIYCLDHNIEISRFDGFILTENNKKHYPDFIVNGEVIEIKGHVFNEMRFAENCRAVESHGYVHKILYKSDLSPYFDYVCGKYNVSVYGKKFGIHTLYDNYCAIYTYVCAECNKEYSTSLLKTGVGCCSRKCSALHARKLRKMPSSSSG